MEWLKKVAPTVASLLGSPLAGIAVEALGNILGGEKTPEAIKDALQKNTLTSDQLAAIRAADVNLQLKMKELNIDIQKLEMEDRQSARDMQIKTGAKTVPVLASVVTVGFFGILIGLMTGDLKMWEGHAELQMLVGSLASAWAMIVSFYFGSSHQPEKTEGK